jgi:hypothetical protein
MGEMSAAPLEWHPSMGPCQARGFTGAQLGAPCPDCGHNNLVHPGIHNPALMACVICELLQHIPPPY